MKKLIEKRNNLLNELDTIVKLAETETRAFSQEEDKKFSEIKTQIEEIDKTIKQIEEQRAFSKKTEPITATTDEVEERAFVEFVRGTLEERANMANDANGAIIPKSIANKIIKKIYETCPIYEKSSRYNVKGNFSIPFYDEDTDKITVEYASEFTDPTAHSGKFLSIELKGYLARASSLISKSLINNSDFDVVSFIVNDMAESFTRWIEKELLNGTLDKVEGLKGVKQTVTSGSPLAITSDELINLQEAVADKFQKDSIFIMSRATRTTIRKLKDADGNYLLNRDINAKWGYTLLGKEVYTSDNMADIATKKTIIFYGDMSGLAVKVSENINIEILREKYAEQHAIGVIGFVEIDSKVENVQKIAKLVMA
ncbi:MAG: phage major capsid protein [Oscillospiraceae bacterium]